MNRDAFLQAPGFCGLPDLRFVWPPFQPGPGFNFTLIPKERDFPGRLLEEAQHASLRGFCHGDRGTAGDAVGEDTQQAHVAGYNMEVLGALSVCWEDSIWRGFTPTPGIVKSSFFEQNSHTATTTPRLFLHFSRLPGPLFASRKPRLPLVFPFQLCSVLCCRSRLRQDTKPWTTRHGLKRHEEMHTTRRVAGQVPDQWLMDSSLHICPVCSRLLSARTRPRRPRCNPSLKNPDFHFVEGPRHPDLTTSSSPEYTSEHTYHRQLRKAGLVALWPACQESLHITTQEPGLTSHASRNSSSHANVEAEQHMIFQRHATNVRGLKEPVVPFGRNC